MTRVVIIGAGLMGRWHAYYAKRQGAVIAAIVDPRIDAAKNLAKTTGGKPYSAIAECLETETVNVVHICAPTDRHVELAMKVLASGKHVIIEKPIARTSAETKLLLDLAQSKGVWLVPVHQFPFQRGFAKFLEALKELGDPVLANFEICTAGGPEVEVDSQEFLYEILPHPLSVFRVLFGTQALENLVVHAADSQVLEIGGRAGTSLHRTFITRRGRPTRAALTYTAEKRSAHVDFFHGYYFQDRSEVSRGGKIARPLTYGLRLFDAAGRNLGGRAVRREWAYPGLPDLLRLVYESLAQGIPPPISHAATLQIATTIDCLRASNALSL